MKIKLTDRMNTVAGMVIKGESAADIGTDHGFIPAYLISESMCPKVILTDIAEGPLSRAKEHFKEFGLDGDFRLGPGLDTLAESEVSTVIIAGMGGETIKGILSKDMPKTKSYKRIVIQPRTYIGELRVWLSENGFEFVDYALCREKDLINEVMAVSPGKGGKENPLISDFLLKKGDPLLDEYIGRIIRNKKDILIQLENSRKDNKKLVSELNEDLKYLESIR